MNSIMEKEKEGVFTHLAVESQEHNHDEEKCGPQSRERHHAHGTGVSDKSQARTCEGQDGKDSKCAGFSCRCRIFST